MVRLNLTYVQAVNELVSLRKKHGISQRTMAERCNMGLTTIVRFEKGKRMNIDNLMSYADALNSRISFSVTSPES